tara:strand:+ start:2641 stop:2898 length:258 start_codon:yes stop_codon:yes gene_type:complete
MDLETIQTHKTFKNTYSNYPSLPRYFTIDSKQEVTRAKRLCIPSVKENALGNYEQSLLRGFNKRVSNWFKDHKEYIDKKNLYTAQ